jgi:hypothetical protein
MRVVTDGSKIAAIAFAAFLLSATPALAETYTLIESTSGQANAAGATTLRSTTIPPLLASETLMVCPSYQSAAPSIGGLAIQLNGTNASTLPAVANGTFYKGCILYEQTPNAFNTVGYSYEGNVAANTTLLLNGASGPMWTLGFPLTFIYTSNGGGTFSWRLRIWKITPSSSSSVSSASSSGQTLSASDSAAIAAIPTAISFQSFIFGWAIIAAIFIAALALGWKLWKG